MSSLKNYEKAKSIVNAYTKPMQTNTNAGLISYNNAVAIVHTQLDNGVENPHVPDMSK